MENGGLNGKFIAETLMTKYNDNMIGYDLISGRLAINIKLKIFFKIPMQICLKKELSTVS